MNDASTGVGGERGSVADEVVVARGAGEDVGESALQVSSVGPAEVVESRAVGLIDAEEGAHSGKVGVGAGERKGRERWERAER